MRLRHLLAAGFLLLAPAERAGAQDLFAAADKAPRYDRYATPAACVAGVKRIETRARWGQSPDTLPYDTARPLPAAAAELARRCIARFRPTGGRPDSLARRNAHALFRLAAIAGDDSLAASSLRLMLADQRLKADSVDLLFTVLGTSATARPVRLARSRAVAARLDTLGVIGDRSAGWWMSQHQLPLMAAQAAMDSAAIAGEAAGLLANVAALPPSVRDDGTFDVQVSGMQALTAEMLPRLGGGIDSAIARLRRRADSILGPRALATSPLGSALPLLGKRAPRLEADFWFGRPPGDSLLPRPGRVTLVQYVDPRCTSCDFAVLRRLKQRFGDKIDLVLLVATRGHFRSHPPLEPAREAELVREYYLDFHRLPATLGVSTTPFTRRPDPDRRRVDQRVPAVEGYRYGAGALLVDRRGVLVFPATSATMPEAEAFVARVIEVLLR